MKNRSIILLVMLCVAAVAVLSGCLQPDTGAGTRITTGLNASDITTGGNPIDVTISKLESTQQIKKFSSAKDIREYLKANSASGYIQGIPLGGFMVGTAAPVPMMPSVLMPTATPAIKAVAESGAVDYSTTNIQVQGVDEGDFVKNDGKYIYVLAQNKLVIVDAFPAAQANTLSTTELQGRPRNIFVSGDRLIVFTEDDAQVMVFPQYDYRPMPRYTTKTNAIIYDISDRKKPVQVSNFSINGNFFQSRMIGDYVYFIVKDSVYYYNDFVDVPVIMKGPTKIMSPDVYYFDNPEQNFVFHTIASVNIKSDKINAKSFMMGYSDNLYVSENNIYITYRKNQPVPYYNAQNEERFYAVVLPYLPKDAQDKIIAIRDTTGLSSSEKWDNISSIMEDTYNKMTESQKQEYTTNVQKAAEEYETKLAQERDRTVIQKININKGDIEYMAKGEIPGSLLNQFSMDESGDNFRVATTSQIWTGMGSKQYNNVYVLDKDLVITGKLEEIAKDERIYSTRFIGNRLYMVTFKRMDPLFVIDLSDPKNPKVLGELKIPGFSDYLHPYDENHIIGVGKETADNQWGGTSIKGVKLSLFDVSDVSNPKQLDQYEIGASGTDSEALQDHRAFLFDKKKNLLVIPVREVKDTPGYYQGYYMRNVWQGAYVFNLTLKDGFKLKGKISHLDDLEQDIYWGNSPSAVRRSMFMDDVVYTVSARKIKMNDLNNMTEINSIDLPFLKDMYWQYGWN